MFAVDMAILDRSTQAAPFPLPQIPPIIVININRCRKQVGSMDPPSRATGKFTSISPSDFQKYPVERMLREAFGLAGIEVSEKIIRGVLEQYTTNPTKELVFYFPGTDSFEKADLEGTVTMQFIENPSALSEKE